MTPARRKRVGSFLDFFYQERQEQCNISMLRHICAGLAGGFRKVKFHSIQGNTPLAGGLDLD